MVSNIPTPPSLTLSVYIVLWHREGGELNQREGQFRGNSLQSWDENTIMTEYVSSL